MNTLFKIHLQWHFLAAQSTPTNAQVFAKKDSFFMRMLLCVNSVFCSQSTLSFSNQMKYFQVMWCKRIDVNKCIFQKQDLTYLYSWIYLCYRIKIHSDKILITRCTKAEGQVWYTISWQVNSGTHWYNTSTTK